MVLTFVLTCKDGFDLSSLKDNFIKPSSQYITACCSVSNPTEKMKRLQWIHSIKNRKLANFLIFIIIQNFCFMTLPSLHSCVGDRWLVSRSWWVIVEAEEAPPILDTEPDRDFCRREFKSEDGLSVYLPCGCVWISKQVD